MKRVIGTLLGCCVAISAAADQKFCGYRDFFHFSDSTHPTIYIVSANSNQDIALSVIGPRSFELRDTDQCRTGFAHVTITDNAYNWCVLDLKDGPYKNHPSVTASCSGIVYKGLHHDGIGSHSYTLRFD
jgi:hypothetical protein